MSALWARKRLLAAARISRVPGAVRIAGLTAVAVALVAGCAGNGSAGLTGPLPTFAYSMPPADSPTPAPTTPATALALLARMAVKQQATAAPFTESAFGAVRRPPRTASPCNSTDVVLQRDLVDLTLQAGSTCSVMSGALFDEYSGHWYWYLHSKPALNQVGVDHVVALQNAWNTGASLWPPNILNAFLNDPMELRATSAQEITAKGSNDAAGWLPSNPQGRCWYAVDQVAIKFIYQLWVTPAEKAALTKVLTACSAAPASLRPTSSPPPTPTPTKASPTPKPKSVQRAPAPKPAPTVTITIIRTPSPSPTPTPSPHPTPTP